MHSRFILTLIVASAMACTALAGTTRIKLGTLVPKGTSYHDALMTMGDTWRRETDGRIELTVFAGGAKGGESKMVSDMQLNGLQAAMLTAVGLSEIEPSIVGLQNLPMGFRDLAEVDYVGSKMRPLLEERMAGKGFIVLFWTDAGWVRFFTTQPVATPDDMRKLKLFTWAGNEEQERLMRSAKFNPQPLETAEIVPCLQTGLIEAVPLPPFFAMASQVDLRAKYMLDLNWAPLVGACVVRRETWEKLSAADRSAMLAAAVVAGEATKSNGRRESDESVAAMQKRGLTVTRLTPEIELAWRQAAEGVYPEIRGGLIAEDVFDRTVQLIAEYRAGHHD